MKNLKLSFAFFVAILVVGITLVTKANFFGPKSVTLCFTQLSIQGTVGFVSTLDASLNLSCSATKGEVSLKPIIIYGNVSTALPNSSGCPANVFFCCAKVTEMFNFDPLYPAAPFVDLGDGLRKYKINSPTDVYCKLN